MAAEISSAFVAIEGDVLPTRPGCYTSPQMAENRNLSFQDCRLTSYPIGLIVRVLLWSGRVVVAQVIKAETTALGTFLHVEFGDEVANVTFEQVTGFYDFCFLKGPAKMRSIQKHVKKRVGRPE
jgi:hypothetical protein